MESIVERLFLGEVEEKNIFPFPYLEGEEKQSLQELLPAVQNFIEEKVDSAKIDTQEEISSQLIEEMAQLGLLGMTVEESMGGMGLDHTSYLRLSGEIAGRDGSVGVFLGGHQSIGYRALLDCGSEEQKKKWLPPLAKGEKIAAFCLTEPGAGSDAYSIQTKATKQKDGSYHLTGQKLWITNGGLADFYTVFAKTGGKKGENISAFIVEKGMEGLNFGQKEEKMGLKGSETRAIFLEKVKVPPENLIGQEGEGFKIAMNVLNMGRLSLSAGCVEAMKKVIKLATSHARSRKQFGKTIDQFGMIQEKLCQMSALTYAVESMVYLTSGNIHRGMENYSLESAICKIFASEAAWTTIDHGLQIAGGQGYMKEYPYERIMRDMRINLIFEGTNEILRSFLALSGVSGPSEQLKDIGKLADISMALQEPLKSLGVLTKFAGKRIEKMVGLTTLTLHHPHLAKWGEIFSTMLGAFSIRVENSLIKHGKKIIHRQLAQKQLANMAINLFAIVACISRTSSILHSKEVEEEKQKYCLNLAHYSCTLCRHQFMANLKEMDRGKDNLTTSIASKISEQNCYGLDIINF